MSYEYGNNGSYGGLGDVWNMGSHFGNYELGEGHLSTYGGLEGYWGFGMMPKGRAKGSAKGSAKRRPKAKAQAKRVAKRVAKHIAKATAALPPGQAAAIMGKLPPKVVANMEAAGILPPMDAAAPAAPTTDPAAPTDPKQPTVVPALFPPPGMLMQPGMLPGGVKPQAHVPATRTITPQQTRMAQIAAGLAAGLLFL